MAWTQDDFNNVETVVRDGTRKISMSSESRALTYMNTPLPDLIKLRDAIRLEIEATAASSNRRPRLYLMRHRRGL